MKPIKYAGSVLLLVVFLFLPFRAFGADKPVLEVESKSGYANGTVEVNVLLSSNSNLAAATFELVYDTDVLEIEGARRGDDLTSGMADVYHNKDTGKVRMAYINMDGFNGSGKILSINFRIKDNAAGRTAISIIVEDFADNEYKDIPYDLISGSMEILTPGYTVRFINGSTVHHTASFASGTLVNEPAVLQREGHVFKGWFKDEGFKSLWDFNTERISADLTLYAGWEIESKTPQADTIVIPYTLKDGEDPDSVVVYEDDREKTDRPVAGRYVEELKSVVIKGEESKNYEISYNKVSFLDVTGDSWYYKAISFLAARQIVRGVGGNRFAPGNNVLRADFLIMTMNAFGIEVKDNVLNNFADSGNKYYTKYLGTAKELGFVLGSGNNMFRPEDFISRQDMMLILYRILDYANMLPVNKGALKASGFNDYKDISGYALPVVEFFVEHNIIKGSQNRLSPKNTLTRAEAAQVIYNLLTVD